MKNILLIAVVSFIILIGLAIVLSLVVSESDFAFGKTVGIVPIKGELSQQQPFLGGNPTASEIVELLENAEDDPAVGVILLDIDSGGGSVVASRQIAYKVRDLNKPVVSWIGDIGASGAYYVAAASDYVMADPDSITASIGVISVMPNYEELLEKIGVRMRVLKEGELKDIGSPFSELSEEEEAIIQEILHLAFERFKADLLSFRQETISPQEFDSLADGRIMSGEQAMEAGLVDGLGTREEAIAKAWEVAGFKGEPVVKHFEKQAPTLLDMISAMGGSFGFALKNSLTQSQTSIRT